MLRKVILALALSSLAGASALAQQPSFRTIQSSNDPTGPLGLLTNLNGGQEIDLINAPTTASQSFAFWQTGNSNVRKLLLGINSVGGMTLNGSGPLASQTNILSLGTQPPFSPNTVLWNGAPVRVGSVLTTATNVGNGSSDEFMTYLQANMAPTYTNLTTSSGTASGTTLTFASIPANIVAGMSVYDVTALGAISPSAKVQSVTATTIVLTIGVLSAVGSGDTIVVQWPNFKGPLFVQSVCQDYSSPGSTACNAITVQSTIATGNAHGYAEGIVVYGQDQGGGAEGVEIGAEIGITNNASSNSIRCDQSPLSTPCHTGIWLGNNGTKAGSWMIDSYGSGPGWNNGIGIRNVASNGLALSIPNNTYISAANAANTTQYPLMFLDINNNLNLGISGGSNDIVFNTGVYYNGGGMKHLRIASCTTGAGATLTTCATALSWITPFADANYTSTCTFEAGTLAFVAFVSAKTASGMNVTIASLTTAAASGTIDCIAIHD